MQTPAALNHSKVSQLLTSTYPENTDNGPELDAESSVASVKLEAALTEPVPDVENRVTEPAADVEYLIRSTQRCMEVILVAVPKDQARH